MSRLLQLREHDNRDRDQMIGFLEDRVNALKAFPLTDAMLCPKCDNVFAKGPDNCPRCGSSEEFIGIASLVETALQDIYAIFGRER
jgi:hypothetical protein